MRVESLEELSAAFNEWRGKKKHAREAMPEELIERARRAVSVHGASRVARTFGIKYERLLGRPRRPNSLGGGAEVPSYSRIEFGPTGVGARPFAEVESPNGVKVRLYSPTPEALSLLASACVSGGTR